MRQRHTKGWIPVLGLLGLLSLGGLHSPARGDDVQTSLGQQAVFLSLNSHSIRLDGGTPVFPPAVIVQGKKGHVVTVTATVFAFSFDDKELAMLPVVNNRFLQPPFSQSFPACPVAGGSTCAATGTWVADLDALEQSAPSQFIGQPLTVTFFVTDRANRTAPRSVSGTFIVRLEKKR